MIFGRRTRLRSVMKYILIGTALKVIVYPGDKSHGSFRGLNPLSMPTFDNINRNKFCGIKTALL